MNDVVIKVKADNETNMGLGDARRDIDKFGRDVTKIGIKSGAEAGAALATSLAKSAAPVAGMLTQLLGVGAVAAAPLIGASLSAAVVGGSGVLGVAGGLALAARDPRVKAAGAALGETVMGELMQKSAVFIRPALESIDKLKVAFRDIGGDLESIFSNSSKFVGPLVDGLISGTKKIISGITTAISRAGPVVDGLSKLFDDFGGAVGKAFERLSENPEDARAAIDALNQALTATVSITADVAAAVGSGASSMQEFDRSTAGVLNPLKTLPGFFSTLTGSSEEYSHKLKMVTDQTEEVTQATYDERAALSALSKELRAQSDPVFGLLNAQDKLRSAQQKVAESTEKHGRRSRETKAALRDLATAALDVVGKAGALGSGFDGKMTPAMKRALAAAGLTKRQIADLSAQLRSAKRAADNLAGTYRVNVVYNVGKQVGGLKGNASAYAHGGIVGAAASGGVRSGMTLVGEEGPELVELPVGSRVNPAGTTKAMMAQGGGPMELVVRSAERASYDLMQIIVENLRYDIRTLGGGSVQRHLGVAGVAA